jgi:hypothetical protein
LFKDAVFAIGKNDFSMEELLEFIETVDKNKDGKISKN